MSTPKLNNTSFKYITWSKLSNLLKQCCNGGVGGGTERVGFTAARLYFLIVFPKFKVKTINTAGEKWDVC